MGNGEFARSLRVIWRAPQRLVSPRQGCIRIRVATGQIFSAKDGQGRTCPQSGRDLARQPAARTGLPLGNLVPSLSLEASASAVGQGHAIASSFGKLYAAHLRSFALRSPDE